MPREDQAYQFVSRWMRVAASVALIVLAIMVSLNAISIMSAFALGFFAIIAAAGLIILAYIALPAEQVDEVSRAQIERMAEAAYLHDWGDVYESTHPASWDTANPISKDVYRKHVEDILTAGGIEFETSSNEDDE